jgi:HD-GYP domain-containing protein (c-di-GMP phosphodiesterase class II)
LCHTNREMKKNYRVTKSNAEIELVLANAMKHKKSLTLWQTSEKGRKISHVQIIGIDRIEHQISLNLPETVDPDLNCFIKFADTDSVSRSEIVVVLKDQLVLTLPEEMVFFEKREDTRHAFHLQDEKMVEIGIGTKTKIVSILNASKRGLTMVLSAKDDSVFTVGSNFKLLKVGQSTLQTPIDAVIRHHRSFERRTDQTTEKLTSFGVELMGNIPKLFLEQLALTEKKMSVMDSKFYADIAYREEVHRKMAESVGQIKQNKKLSALIDKLKDGSLESNYLKNHMDLLAEVMCEIGRSVGWVTVKTFEKLIYAAYLHDIRYFEIPKLARIKTKHELELIRHELTEAEVFTFLEGPIYASEIAKNDYRAFPEVSKMLLQHRELPNGEGFPNRLRSSHLTPLTCLFMISHDFVDYVLENSNWSYKEFVAKAKKIYRGVYFSKIIKEFENKV